MIPSGKATHERHPGQASLLDLFSNCEWAWKHTQQACFFTMLESVPDSSPRLLSVFMVAKRVFVPMRVRSGSEVCVLSQ